MSESNPSCAIGNDSATTLCDTPSSSLPAPRFSIGDTVFVADTTRTRARHECPDCNGTRRWSCKSPAGVEMEMDCPRCQRHGGWGDKLGLEFTKYETAVRQLTIGSIRIDTAAKEHPVEYMCYETGIGSGNIYYEDRFHASRESAEIEARAKALALQREEDATPQAMQAATYGRLGYFDAMMSSIREEIEQQVRDSMKNELPPSGGAHTPGEWRANGDLNSEDGVFRFDVEAVDVASGNSLGICSGYGGLSPHFATRESGPANARLLSAAPNLLAALLELSEAELLDDDDPRLMAARQQADAAIAKATGAQS